MGVDITCLLALDRSQRCFRLECRGVVPACSSRHGLSCSRPSGRVQAETPLIPDVQISRATSESERIRYTQPDGVTLVAQIDMDAFAIALRNLIDNAASHGLGGVIIDVMVGPHGVARIINHGPMIAKDVLPKKKHRFARGETCHAGSGSGLPIVDTIIAQTGGNLEIFSPARGRADGFEAQLTCMHRCPLERLGMAGIGFCRPSNRETGDQGKF